MRRGSDKGRQSSRGGSEVTLDSPALVDDEKLEAIRRQLDAEFGRPAAHASSPRPRGRGAAPRRARPVAFFVAAFLLTAATIVSVSMLYRTHVGRPPSAAAPVAPEPAPVPSESVAIPEPETAAPKPETTPSVTLPPRAPRDTPRRPDSTGSSSGAFVDRPPSPSSAVTPAAPSESVNVAPAPPARVERTRATSAQEMSHYADPGGRFDIGYPSSWRVRAPATGATGNTTFHLDHPDGVAVTVFSPGLVHGRARASVVTAILTQQFRKLYPDFQFTQVATTAQDGGRERSAVVARWTNHWGQPMRGKGVLVSTDDGVQTTYVYVVGQAQEFIFPSVEPTIERTLASFQAAR